MSCWKVSCRLGSEPLRPRSHREGKAAPPPLDRGSFHRTVVLFSQCTASRPSAAELRRGPEPLRCRTLPNHLQAELHAASRHSGSSNRPEGRTLCVGVGVSELSVVQRVERLPTELRIEPLRDPEVLEQAGIPVVQSRLLVSIAASVADHANPVALGITRKVECAGIPVAIRSGGSREWIPDYLRDRSREAANQDPVRPQTQGLELALGKRQNSVGLPSAQQEVRCLVDARTELLASTERQFIGKAGDKAVRHVKRAVSLVPLLVLGGDRGELVGRAEIQSLLPGVGTQQIQAGSQPAFDLRG
jgi:hypothetical protein